MVVSDEGGSWDGTDDDTVARSSGDADSGGGAQFDGELEGTSSPPGADDVVEGATLVRPRRDIPAIDPDSLDEVEGDTVISRRQDEVEGDTVISGRQGEIDGDTVMSQRLSSAVDSDADDTMLSARWQSSPGVADEATQRRTATSGGPGGAPRAAPSGVETPEDSSQIVETTEPRAPQNRPARQLRPRARVGRAEIPVDPTSPLGIERYQVRSGPDATDPQRYSYGIPSTRRRTGVPDAPPPVSATPPVPRVRGRFVALVVSGVVVIAVIIGVLLWV